jgi:HSP20 family protein
MALVRWEPVREIHSLQQEMNRLFGSFFDTPAMDLVETEQHFVLRADLPGLTESDVNIELEDNVLTVSGERASEKREEREGYYRIERASGRFARSLTLPDGVDAESIEASFSNGVLEVRVPKPQERKPQKVAIGISKPGDTIEGTSSGSESAGGQPAGDLAGAPTS